MTAPDPAMAAQISSDAGDGVLNATGFDDGLVPTGDDVG